MYAAHGRETSIRVFEGEIEELTAAESAGVGVRVISGGRQGFSYVGALDEAAASEALDEARDNASFATFDENVGLAVTRRRRGTGARAMARGARLVPDRRETRARP